MGPRPSEQIQNVLTVCKRSGCWIPNLDPDSSVQREGFEVLLGSWIFEFGDDLGNDVVGLSEIPQRAEREQGSCVQDEVFASGLRTRCCHFVSRALGIFDDSSGS